MPLKYLRLFTLLMVALLATSAHGDANWKQTSNAEAAKLDQCVAPTPFMRRNHFELIKHQRDVTVHQGIRKTDDSLAGCVSCHASYDEQGHANPVNAPGEFCAGCHEYTAVNIHCFDCHSTVPEGHVAKPVDH